MIVWIVAVIGLAAGITYAVVRLTPEKQEKPEEPAEA